VAVSALDVVLIVAKALLFSFSRLIIILMIFSALDDELPNKLYNCYYYYRYIYFYVVLFPYSLVLDDEWALFVRLLFVVDGPICKLLFSDALLIDD
jgi:hypothetical protein